ncbi:MAG: hypothetical protein ACK5P3_16955, partial [Dolichospermum sp.]
CAWSGSLFHESCVSPIYFSVPYSLSIPYCLTFFYDTFLSIAKITDKPLRIGFIAANFLRR